MQCSGAHEKLVYAFCTIFDQNGVNSVFYKCFYLLFIYSAINLPIAAKLTSSLGFFSPLAMPLWVALWLRQNSPKLAN